MSDYPIWPSTLPPCPVASDIIRRVAEAGPDYVERTWAMSDELVPVVGGPKNGESWKWSTASTLTIPDAKDRIEKITPEGIVTLFGQHTYRLNCYANDGGKFYRWDYVGYEPPWNIPASDDIVDRIRFAFSGDAFWDTDAPPLLENAVKEIERLRHERQWIPVSERLPEYSDDVLVCGPGVEPGTMFQTTGFFYSDDDTGWVVYGAEVGVRPDDFIPTHWMPLPQPPPSA